MMDKRWLALPLLALAGPGLSGCVAAAIPALAGAGMIGTRIDGKDAGEPEIAQAPAPVPTPAPAPVAAPVPTVTVMIPPPAPPPVSARPPMAAAPAPVMAAPAPTVATVVPPRPAVVTPAPAPAPAPQIIATEPMPAMPPRVAPPAAVTPPPVSTIAATAPAAAAPMVAYPDPSRPLAPDQANFARFVRYSQASAASARDGVELPSALLSDPVAVDGKRRRCVAGEQLVALIDLDPAGGLFDPPADPAGQPGLALGLAVLRDAGIEIAWLTDLPVSQSGAVRTALEKAGLDPRGQDIISLRRDESDTKQQRRDNLAGITCIVAIAGDERPDFDERYKYLRSPEAGAGLEPLIGDGWFLVAPLLGK